MQPRLQLASTSPRRRQLLSAAGIAFTLCEPGVEYTADGTDEHSAQPGDPARHALERAVRKATGALVVDRHLPVLGVDTVVDLDGEELGKPRTRSDAEAMLLRLAGRRHVVHTAHCLFVPATGWQATRVATAVVASGTPAPADLRAYVDSDQWRGKAGSYGIQDSAQGFLTVVEGAFDTVMGLHVPAVRELLAVAPEVP